MYNISNQAQLSNHFSDKITVNVLVSHKYYFQIKFFYDPRNTRTSFIEETNLML